jgi:hypothetical protein
MAGLILLRMKEDDILVWIRAWDIADRIVGGSEQSQEAIV